jgi:hypothetical protein
MATRAMTRQASIFILFPKYGHRQYAVRIARPVCALGNEDRQRSWVVSIIVLKSSIGKEQNGLGKFTENLISA